MTEVKEGGPLSVRRSRAGGLRGGELAMEMPRVPRSRPRRARLERWPLLRSEPGSSSPAPNSRLAVSRSLASTICPSERGRADRTTLPPTEGNAGTPKQERPGREVVSPPAPSPTLRSPALVSRTSGRLYFGSYIPTNLSQTSRRVFANSRNGGSGIVDSSFEGPAWTGCELSRSARMRQGP